MKKIISILIFGLLLQGCLFSSKDNLGARYESVLKISTDCKPCGHTAYSTYIDGNAYSSDIAIKCCENSRKINKSLVFKKVYFHHISDLTGSAKIVNLNTRNGKTTLKAQRQLDGIFYFMLEKELKSRGILVVDNQNSPYTIKLDFEILDFLGNYDANRNFYSSNLSARAVLKNIDKSKKYEIFTTQNVNGLKANKAKDLYLYFDILAKQAANKVANLIDEF